MLNAYVSDASCLCSLLNVRDLRGVVSVNEEQEADLQQRVHLDKDIVWTHMVLEDAREVLLAVLELLRLLVARLLQPDKVYNVLILWNPCVEVCRRCRIACVISDQLNSRQYPCSSCQ